MVPERHNAIDAAVARFEARDGAGGGESEADEEQVEAAVCVCVCVRV